MNRAERIKYLAITKLSASCVELEDQSARHAGHAGARPEGETHYKLVVESPLFTGLSKVKRHQAVYAALGEEFGAGLHALSIEAKAPGE